MMNSKVRREEGQTGRSKRADLVKEFQEFKMKIQEFEDKNDQIITRIREACSLKKKQAQQQLPHSRVVYYDRGDEADSLNSSNDCSRNIVYDGNLVTHPPPHPQRPRPHHGYYKKESIPFNPSSQEYLDEKARQTPDKPLRSSHNKSSRGLKATKAYSSQGVPPDYLQLRQDQYQDSRGRERRQTGRFIDSSSDLENLLKEAAQKNKELEGLVAEKDDEVRGVQARMRGFATCFRRMVADQLQNYHEDVVTHRMLELQKCFKRYDNRLRNLNLKVKDAIEDRKAHRVIRKSKRRRSNSRYNQNSTSSVQMKESSVCGPRDLPKGTSPRPSLKNQEAKQKQFAQIANGYEKMIKTKVEELERVEERLREEVVGRQSIGGELKRARLQIEEKDNEISELKMQMRTQKYEVVVEEGELKSLRAKIQSLESELRSRDQREKQLSSSVQKLQKSKRAASEELRENFNKALSKKSTSVSELEEKLKKSEAIHLKEISQMKERLVEAEKSLMEKDCQILGLSSKVKKVEADCSLKEEKLKQLEGLIIRDAEPDILDRSISVDNSLVSASEVRMLQDAIRRLQEETDQKTALSQSLERQVFELEASSADAKLQKHALLKKVEDLEGKIREQEEEPGDGLLDRQSEATRQLRDRVIELEQIEAERAQLVEERECLVEKSNLLLEQVKKLQEENLAFSRQLIKLKSELSFSRAEFADLDKRHSRLKDEAYEAKAKMGEETQKQEERDKALVQKIRELETQVEICRNSQTELEIGRREDQNILNSINISEMSFNMPSNTQKALEEELAAVKDRLRQVEAAADGREDIERQMQNQYRSNLDLIRTDLADKNKELQRRQAECEQVRKQMRLFQQQQREDLSFQNYKVALYEEKIVQLEVDFNISKESEQKLNDLLHQLTQNLRGKAEEREDLLRDLDLKDKAIQELRELLELKESKECIRQSIKSCNDRESLNRDFSLRMSADQSDEVSDLAQVSYLSNISDVFKRDDLLQEKMRRGKTSREEFVRLFTKTSAYIRSLKDTIEGKDRRIKQLERQLSGAKKEGPQLNWSGAKERKLELNMLKTCPLDESHHSVEQFKDEYSVQIDSKRSKSYELIKELQKQKALAIEENKMLVHQIELLQDEISRAEEQENNLVRIKDLYKDQIKKLMEKNEEHTQEFQLQIHKLKGQLNQSESFHNWEAVKQLFVKVVRCVAAMEEQAGKVKRDEKRKELEEFTKVLSSILGLEVALRDKLLAALRK